jgi:hypothetical protein
VYGFTFGPTLENLAELFFTEFLYFLDVMVEAGLIQFAD